MVGASDSTDCGCEPEPKSAECQCSFRQVTHKGGTSANTIRHNLCADTTGPNLYPGQDTEVCLPQGGQCISYDTALPDGKTFCEVKVYDFNNNQFLIERTNLLEYDRERAMLQNRIANECKINYCYVVADPRHLPIVAAWGVTSDIRLRPECLAP